MADWIKVKNDYINGNISYRKLAKKHGVGYSALTKRATDEKWFEKRAEQRAKIEKKIEQKTAEKLAEAEANRLLRISAAADRLLAKIEEATEQLDQFIVTSRGKQREIEYETEKAGFGKPKRETVKEVEDKRVVSAGHLDRMGLKQLTSALKDLRDIQFASAEGKQDESPNITINVSAATLADAEEE